MDIPEHSQLLKLESAVKAQIQDYGSCLLNEKARIQKLNAGIQDALSKIRGLSRELELLVEELDGAEERQYVATLLTAHANEYNTIQQSLRQAVYQQRQNAINLAAQERAELLQGSDAAQRRHQLQNDSDLVAASEGVTESLRRTRQMLGEELEHTGSTLAAMEASHSQLGKTHDEYIGQHSMLNTSKGLLRMLDWQNKAETYMLWFGLALFALVSAYVVQKRVTYFVPVALRPSTLVGKLIPSSPPLAPPSPIVPHQNEHKDNEGGIDIEYRAGTIPNIDNNDDDKVVNVAQSGTPHPAEQAAPVDSIKEELGLFQDIGDNYDGIDEEAEVVDSDAQQEIGEEQEEEVKTDELAVLAVDMEAEFVRTSPGASDPDNVEEHNEL